jgi:Tetratricopeptide repeat
MIGAQTTLPQLPINLKAPALSALRLPGLGASGSRLLDEGKTQEAVSFYQQMLGEDPASREAHAGLYRAYSALGDSHRAVSHLGMALRWPAVLTLPYRGARKPVPLLLLLSMNAGNVLLQRFLNDRLFQTYVVLMEFFDDSAVLPHHELIVNAVGDADVRSEALAVAERVIARSSAPVINPPAQVLATGRCSNAQRLRDIPGVIAPRSVECSRERLMTATTADELREQGFEFPLLVRTPGCHMGKNFIRVETPGELSAAIAELPGAGLLGDDLIVMQYLDGQGADGNIRKYRVLMIGGKLYPVHLAISRHWKIHYFSADMADHPQHRAEEAHFLLDIPGVLGPAVMTALMRVQETLGLDYGGIDFGLNAQGQVLLYEANATMAVYRPDTDSKWDYRRPVIERIYAAVQELFLSRAKRVV